MTQQITIPPQPWTQPKQQLLKRLDVAPGNGLDKQGVQKRLDKFGENRLKAVDHKSTWLILADQFKDLIVILLAVSAGLAFAFGDVIDGVAIIAVILINAAIGFFTELKAIRSMEALREMGHVDAKVRRNGQVEEIPAEKLVPGDIMLVDGGDIITADLRLIKASKLQVNESALTGESVPVSKQVEPLQGEVPLAERSNMLYKGTSVTRGRGEGVVVATSMETELGQISSLVEEAEEESTPLEDRLNQLGQKLVWVTVGLIVFVALIGILQGKEIRLMIETAIALGVAAIPEGLPIVATIALARGMMRMAKRNALINRLAAVETLGGTNVICTDKTGTLTENQMTLTQIALPDGVVKIEGRGLTTTGQFTKHGKDLTVKEDSQLQTALEVGLLCNNAALSQATEQVDESNGNKPDERAYNPIGDPVEVALLVAAAKANLKRDDLLEQYPEAKEVAFDADVKMMATYHQVDDGYRVAVKGAPEPVLEACETFFGEDNQPKLNNQQREEWLTHNEEMAERGLRVLALATKQVASTDAEPYQDLAFIGLVGFVDPPRFDVQEAIESCQQAGIKVVMVTGDQPVTACNIGTAVGLAKGQAEKAIHGSSLKVPTDLSIEEKDEILHTPILARVSPKQKLDLIDIHQQSGAVVAMTGDGVNDAPALKKADIGIAMGQRGTQVAREAADMILQDDAFSTIVVAIKEGRVIFKNIRRFVFFLISCNISEVMVVALASLLNTTLPILPLQILFLNLVTDVFPALALGVGRGESTIMKRPPRDPQEPVLGRKHWIGIGSYGFLITLSVLGALGLAFTWLGMNTEQAVTISFLTLAFAQLWHVFNMRDNDSGFLNNDVVRNPFIWGAIVLCTILLLMAVYIPVLANVLKVQNPGFYGWLLIMGMSLVPLVVGQLYKTFASAETGT